MIHKRNFKETEVGPIPDTWEIKKIGDCCKLIRTSFKPSDEDIRKYIGLEHIEQDKLQLCGVGSSVDIKSNKLQFKSGQILFGKLRPYFRKIIRPKFDGVCSTDIFVIDSKKEYDNGFLFYFFANDDMVKEAIKSSEGTRMPRASWNYLSQIKKPFPPLPEQRAIAHILGTLDDKIELNRRMNETLEAMARAIFKSWFVDFDPVRAKAEGRDTGLPEEITDLFPDSFEETELGEVPKGWTVKALPEAIQVNPSRSLRKGEIAPYLDMGNMPTTSARALQYYEREFGSGMKFVNNDTLVARITPCLENGKTCFVDFLEKRQVGWGSTEYIVLSPKEPLPPEFAYFLARTEVFRAFAISNMTGTSGRQRVPAESLNQFMVAIPSSKIAERFGEFASSIIAVMKANDAESRTLTELRDKLLPKLISGEVQVNGKC